MTFRKYLVVTVTLLSLLICSCEKSKVRTLTGRIIVDSTGLPVANKVFVLFTYGANGWMLKSKSPPERFDFSTDKDGVFHVIFNTSSGYQLNIHHPGDDPDSDLYPLWMGSVSRREYQKHTGDIRIK